MKKVAMKKENEKAELLHLSLDEERFNLYEWNHILKTARGYGEPGTKRHGAWPQSVAKEVYEVSNKKGKMSFNFSISITLKSWLPKVSAYTLMFGYYPQLRETL